MKLTSILLLSLGLVSGVASAGGTTEAGGSVTVGITAFAQNALGDVVFVQ
ncbi:hypothetical protein GHO45_20530, partial [Pseudomonas sp. FSL R10-0765]|nr:hypothetical protein [Pseudomonas sp. FSL R10-0765]